MATEMANQLDDFMKELRTPPRNIETKGNTLEDPQHHKSIKATILQ